jgi:hypothetical protein
VSRNWLVRQAPPARFELSVSQPLCLTLAQLGKAMASRAMTLNSPATSKITRMQSRIWPHYQTGILIEEVFGEYHQWHASLYVPHISMNAPNHKSQTTIQSHYKPIMWSP